MLLNNECSPNSKVHSISSESQIVTASLKKALNKKYNWFSSPAICSNYYSDEVSLQIKRKIYCRKKYILSLKCFQSDFYHSDMFLDVNDLRSPIYTCKFGKSEKTKSVLALACEDGTIVLQQTLRKEMYIGKEEHDDAVFDLCWIPNEDSFLTAVADASLALWTINSDGTLGFIQNFKGHSQAVKCVDVNPWDPNVFASGGRDCNLIIWDTRCARTCKANEINGAHASQKSINSPGLSLSKNQQNSVISVLFNEENKVISAGSADGILKIWDLRKSYCHSKRKPQSLHALHYPGTSSCNGYSCMNISPHKEKVYVSCLDGKIYAYHLTNPTPHPVATYFGHKPKTYYAKTCLSPCGSYLLSGSSDDNAYIWLTDSPGCPIATLTGHCEEVTSVACNNNMFVTCSDDMSYRFFNHCEVDDTDTEKLLELKGLAVPFQESKCRASNFKPLKFIRTQFTNDYCLTHNVSFYGSSSSPSENSSPDSEDLLQSDIYSRVMSTPSQTRLRSKDHVTPGTSEKKTLLNWLSSSKKTPKANHSTSLTPKSVNQSKRKLTDLLESDQENLNMENKNPVLSPSKNILSNRENQQSPNMVKMPKYEKPSTRSNADIETDEYKLMDDADKTLSQFSLYNKHAKISSQSQCSLKDDGKTPVKTFSPLPQTKTPLRTENIASFTSPTANLPNFVIDGRSPHNRESPTVRKRETDWLTTLRRKKSLFSNGKQPIEKEDEKTK